MIQTNIKGAVIIQQNSRNNIFTAMQRQCYAPFGSLVGRRKNKFFEVRPGPGAYDVSLPLIHPLVETIRKKNNNIIIKLNHVGTAAFHLDAPKPQKIDRSIGPGQYFQEVIKTKEKIKWNRGYDKIKQIFVDRPKNRAAIEEIRSISIDEYVEMPEAEKKESHKKKRKIKGTEWSKMQGRPTEKLMSQNLLGPGQYSLGVQNTEHIPSAVFKSQSIRSFFDQIYFETNRKEIAKSRQQMNYKQNSLGPGSYEISPRRKKFHKYQFFNSTEDRT